MNDPRVMRPDERGGYACDAAWADDFHHALRVLLTDDSEGYYAEFGDVWPSWRRRITGRTCTTGSTRAFASADSERRPTTSRPRRFVVFDQNHDQVGNRAYGDRLPVEARPLAAFCTLLSPFTPMLFMGEEYGERAPFQFFSDHIDEEIATATREGRRREFAAFAEFGEEIPDPQARATFEASKLTRERDPQLAELYRRLLEVRREIPTEELCDDRVGRGRALAARAAPAALRAGLQLLGRAGNGALHRWAGACGHARRTRARRGGHRTRVPRGSPDRALSDVWPGRPFPLGAEWDGGGTNFSLFSEHAERVELCLFDGGEAERRIELSERTALNWHCYLPGIGPGQRYGYRVYGPYDPSAGHRFNPTKLLIDPYAKAIDGVVRWQEANVLPYVPTGLEDADLEADDEDSAPAVPKSVVIDQRFDWEGDRRPAIPFPETVIYETHVRGFTMRHPEIREDLRGTYAGLASDPAIEYLTSLGVTAVELLPVHHIADESFLNERGLRNYWGYSTIGYLAPHAEYSASGRRGEQVREFKGMVKALHRAGIEVILDVVYNHTAEGNHLGPMLSLKGVDNTSYYRLVPEDPRFYMDFTGTGNSLNAGQPSVIRLIMDSLRYFVTECHVDGFRFDLASALARQFYEVDRLSAFFDVIHQDPVLSQVKLIAEPWDVGPGGYQVGNFPPGWSEWNGIYRDTIRDFWRGQAGTGEFANRLTGSSDLYQSDGRHPFASVNFTTAHDGFTLLDLVSYNDKHNEANLEDGRDGT